MLSNRQRLTELHAKVRDAANLQDPVARAVIELVKLSYEDLKESLVSADDNDMLRIQGAGRYLLKMHKELTTEPPSITPKE